jgi:SAM-dependent methyltransferase
MNKVSIDLNLLSVDDINTLYKNHVIKDDDYYKKANQKYHELSDFEKIKYDRYDFPRIASLFDYKEWIEKHNLKHVSKLLSTCENDLELEHITFDQITVCDYEKDQKYDLHTMSLDEKDYDLIIFNQTIEHLYNPFVAMKNLYDHLKPGGYLYTTVPIINIPHIVPFHFWGVYPIGLCALSASVGFEVLECGYWGNLNYINSIFSLNGWLNISEIIVDNKIENVEHCQTQTWVLVKK